MPSTSWLRARQALAPALLIILLLQLDACAGERKRGAAGFRDLSVCGRRRNPPPPAVSHLQAPPGAILHLPSHNKSPCLACRA